HKHLSNSSYTAPFLCKIALDLLCQQLCTLHDDWNASAGMDRCTHRIQAIRFEWFNLRTENTGLEQCGADSETSSFEQTKCFCFCRRPDFHPFNCFPEIRKS